MTKYPPYLKTGSTIGLTCPAGYMPLDKARACIHTLQEWGFDVMVGKTLGSKSTNYFSAPDEDRLDELQAMLDDNSIQAILCARGGYGVTRIIDRLDFTKFKKNPKWIIGFSDITVLHCHLYSRLHIASLHAPMANAFNEGPQGNEFIISLHNALIGKKAKYRIDHNLFNKTGATSGELVGGNLSLLAHLTGTPSAIDTKNKILFLEDIGEYIYNIDRMMYQLKRSGQLAKLSGLIIGGFSGMKDTDPPFGKSVYELIREIVQEYDYPICFGFPVSHVKENYALKIGGSYEFKITKTTTTLREI